MITATLIVASAVALVAAIVSYAKASKGCAPHKRPFRLTSALIWLMLASLWFAALFVDIYIIRSGIITRLLIILQAGIYIGELMTD